ncbi:MAG: sodium:calcium antiporter, partial [Methanomicrobiales archaeon HGW-Methanomicrobiales-4]
TTEEMKTVLEKVISDIGAGLKELDVENARSAEELTDIDLTGTEATQILNEKISRTPYGLSSLIITPEGQVSAAAPSVYSGLVGEDLSYQPEVIYANTEEKPIISNVFLMKEGFFGISQSYPIFSSHNEYRGYTDITYRPEEFLSQFIMPIDEQTKYDFFILQPDGMTVYETNPEEIGKNALTDPLYQDPEIHRISENITSEKSGEITYTFWNREWNTKVPRLAVWDTMEYGEQKWRVAIVRDIEEKDNETVAGTDAGWEKTNTLNESISALDLFISEGKSYALEHTKEEALYEFNNLSGPFVSGDKYIFAYDGNGTCLALPYQSGLIGKNRMKLTDINGFAILPALIDVAHMGGGYLYFVYPNPADGFKPELKLFSVAPISDDWFIGSGIYLPKIDAAIHSEDISALLKRVKGAVAHADDVGKKQAIVDFNDINGSFADGGSYIFAYDYNGMTLALPHQPDYIGTNREEFTDKYGSRITRMEIDAAKRGGGYVYVVYYNPETGKDELKLCYVAPAGDDWLVGSGIYTGEEFEA